MGITFRFGCRELNTVLGIAIVMRYGDSRHLTPRLLDGLLEQMR